VSRILTRLLYGLCQRRRRFALGVKRTLVVMLDQFDLRARGRTSADLFIYRQKQKGGIETVLVRRVCRSIPVKKTPVSYKVGHITQGGSWVPVQRGEKRKEGNYN